MHPGARIWRSALALVGTRFRLHGRDPATGLDCVGLVVCACGADRVDVPDRYRLDGNDPLWAEWWLCHHGFARCAAVDAAVGDILLAAPAPRQLHLLVNGIASHVHAHAGLRRVVQTPGCSQFPILSRWRAAANGPLADKGQQPWPR